MDVFQVQEVIQASQVLLDYRETQERRGSVGCLVFLDSLMVISQQHMFQQLNFIASFNWYGVGVGEIYVQIMEYAVQHGR